MLFNRAHITAFATLAVASAVNAAGSWTSDLSNVTLAAVVAAPVNWPLPVYNKTWDGVKYDLNGTVQYGVQLIQEAATSGAALIVFPECWFPGYPKGYDENDWVINHVADYIDNALVVNSTEWNTLVNATANAGIYVALGFTERIDDNIYMAQVLLSPEGDILIHRHKLRPSGTERQLWSDGTIAGLTVVNTTLGRLGMLECWEHLHPAMTFNMQVQLEDIHIGPWPYNQNINSTEALSWEDVNVALSAQRMYSINTGAIGVMGSVGFGAIVSGAEAVVTSDANYVATSGGTEGYAPIIYHTGVNSTAFAKTEYNINGEQSWGILMQMEDGFPSYVPQVEGTYVVRENTSIASLLQYAASNGTSTITGTPANETIAGDDPADEVTASAAATSTVAAAASSSTSTSGAGRATIPLGTIVVLALAIATLL